MTPGADELALGGLDGLDSPAQDRAQGMEAAPDALLATKLYMPPPRRDLVRRPRLTGRLSAGLHGPLTLLVAPAGSGKTSVFADWCAAQQVGAQDAEGDPWPVAWLALDQGDNDLARFLRYLIAALQPLRSGIGGKVLAGLRALQPPDTLLVPLLNDLATLDRDVILVLDDYHVIEDPTIHRALAFLLDHLPPRLHLAMATRVDPPLPLARLRARGQLTELRNAELRFTLDEAAAFLQQTMGVRLAADDVAMLDTCTEGWVAGLQLAALALQGRDPAELRAALAARVSTHRYILDYLADEVFDRQPAEVQDFLLRTSVLDRLSGPLCDALVCDAPEETGSDQALGDGQPIPGHLDGQALLERLETANLFLVPLDDSRTWYRYHQLFAGFLRERLRRRHPDLIAGLHRRASGWFDRHGLAAPAADHALAAADYAQAVRLIEQVIAPTIWQSGELATLQRWLRQLPRDVTGARPRLCLDLAWVALWSAQVDAVEPRLRDAEQALETMETPDSTGRAGPVEGSGPHQHGGARALRGEIAAIRAELARQCGELATALALARQALADLPADDRRVRGVTAGILAGAYLWSGNAAAASRAYGEAATLSRTPDTITLALIASGRLVLTQALQGQLRQAQQTYRQTLDLATAHGMLETPALGVAQVGMAEVLREWNDLDAAEDLVRRGIARCAESAGLAEMALDGSLTLARIAQARGHLEEALQVLQQAEAHAGAHHVLRATERVDVARARLWLTAAPPDVPAARWADLCAAAGHMDAGRMHAGHMDAGCADAGSGYVRLLAQITLARLRLVQGRHEEAAAVLRRVLTNAEAGGLIGSVIEVLVLQARLHEDQGRAGEAMLALSRALTLAEPAGYVRLFVDEGPPIVALLRRAQQRDIAPAYVAALLAACGAAGAAGGMPAPRLVEPLSTREREVVRLLASGLSTTEIAAQLVVSAGTVRNHLKNIYGKLDAHSRLQAVERARTLHLL